MSACARAEPAGLLRGAFHRAGHFGPDPLTRNDGQRNAGACASAGQIAATVCTSISAASETSRSMIKSVFGG